MRNILVAAVLLVFSGGCKSPEVKLPENNPQKYVIDVARDAHH